MALSPDVLRDRFRATLLGCAVGDALGFPFEGANPESIARIPMLGEDFVSRPRGRFRKGQYTDDTQMSLALAEAIIAEGKVDGRAIAQRFAALWTRGLIIGPGKACSESVERLLQGAPWNTAGAPIGRAGNGAAMRAAPLGLFHYDDLSRIPRDADVQSVITHKDPRARAGAAAVATAVALNLHEEPLSAEAFCRRVSRAAAALDPGFASEIERLPQLVRFDPDSAARVIARAGAHPLAPRDWPGISPFVIPSVLMALYAFLRQPNDFRACLVIALRAGGDTDSVAAMAGAISGARLGCEAIPARLRRGVADADAICVIADRLFDLKAAQQKAPAYAFARSRPHARKL